MGAESLEQGPSEPLELYREKKKGRVKADIAQEQVITGIILEKRFTLAPLRVLWIVRNLEGHQPCFWLSSFIENSTQILHILLQQFPFQECKITSGTPSGR